MADDISIVLKTKLDTAEADKQLGEFKKRAETSEIKLKIASESGKNNIQSDIQNAVKAAERVAQSNPIQIKIDTSKIGSAMADLPQKYIAGIQKGLNEFESKFGSITAKLQSTSVEIDPFSNTAKATVQYADGIGKISSVMVQLNAETGEFVGLSKKVVESQAKIDAATAKSNKQLLGFETTYNKLNAEAFEKKEKLTGDFAKPATDSLEAFKAKIEEVKASGNGMTDSAELELKQLQEAAKLAIGVQKSLQFGATDFASKDVAASKQVYGLNADTQIIRLHPLGSAADEIVQKFKDLKSELKGISDMPGLNAWAEKFRVASAEATKLKAEIQQITKDQNIPNGITEKIGKMSDWLGYENLNKNTSGITALRENIKSVISLYEKYKNELSADNVEPEKYQKLIDNISKLDEQYKKLSNTVKKFDDSQASQQWVEKQSINIEKLKSNFATMKEEWSKALEIPKLKAEIDAFESKLGDVDAQNLPNANAAFMALKANIRAAGADCKSFGAQLKDVVKSASGFISIASVFALLRRSITEVVGSVKELNSAMVEFKKVTDLSASGYDNFLKSSAKTAKQIGTDLVDMVSGTADFVKLGYGVNDATNLATQANILYKVGDGFNNIGEATDATIASMKAYGIEASNVSSIVDKLNKVSNETSTDTAGLADAITRSASALNMGGLDIDKSLALIVAGNETVRDSAAVGTALKTLSSRIRGAKTELAAMGEEEDEYVNSTSKLRQSILDLTKVDIMADVDKGQYKDLYTILGEISKVYDKLSDVDKANVMEILFGKRNVNIGASIMQNFDQAEKALNSAQNATGSAMSEHERWMQSIEASEAKAAAAFQEFSNSIMSSGLIKFYYDAKTGFLGFLTAISDRLGTLSATAPMLAGVLSAWKNIGISKVNMPYPTCLSAVA